MRSTLIDAGPLIALFDRDDQFHNAIKEFLRIYKGYLLTTWPVITEVLHMLDFNVNAQNIKEIISIYSNFCIYRNIRNEYLINIFNLCPRI